MNRASIFERFNATVFKKGIVSLSLTPFDEHGKVMMDAVTDQAKRLSQIDGIIGIAVNHTSREREALLPKERIEVIRRTRSGLDPDQLLFACVGELSDAAIDDIAACDTAGANAVITFAPKWQSGRDDPSSNTRLDALADQAGRLPLPVIVALNKDNACRPVISDEIAQHSRKVIGFDMGTDDNVLNYDQGNFTLKAMDRSLACIPSSEGAFFRNLNKFGDGVLSFLAYVAPHEVTLLYQAFRYDRFQDVQAIHNRLSPLVNLLSGHDRDNREMIYRAAAHHRGLLASPNARNISSGLCPHLTRHLHDLIDEIGLKPIKWV